MAKGVLVRRVHAKSLDKAFNVLRDAVEEVWVENIRLNKENKQLTIEIVEKDADIEATIVMVHPRETQLAAIKRWIMAWWYK